MAWSLIVGACSPSEPLQRINDGEPISGASKHLVYTKSGRLSYRYIEGDLGKLVDLGRFQELGPNVGFEELDQQFGAPVERGRHGSVGVYRRYQTADGTIDWVSEPLYECELEPCVGRALRFQLPLTDPAAISPHLRGYLPKRGEVMEISDVHSSQRVLIRRAEGEWTLTWRE